MGCPTCGGTILSEHEAAALRLLLRTTLLDESLNPAAEAILAGLEPDPDAAEHRAVLADVVSGDEHAARWRDQQAAS